MNYLIAVFPNRMIAEEAYTALEKADIPESQIGIVGKGYQTASEFGLIDPNEKAKAGAIRMAYWLVPFGFAAGYVFNDLTKIYLLPAAGDIVNHVLGGLFGAIAGAMGSLFVGGGVGIAVGSGDDLVYQNRLNEGKYLVVIGGSTPIQNQGKTILAGFNPEILSIRS